jgi:hypothetical protein
MENKHLEDSTSNGGWNSFKKKAVSWKLCPDHGEREREREPRDVNAVTHTRERASRASKQAAWSGWAVRRTDRTSSAFLPVRKKL